MEPPLEPSLHLLKCLRLQAQRLPRPWLLVLDGAYASWLQQQDAFQAVLEAFLQPGA